MLDLDRKSGMKTEPVDSTFWMKSFLVYLREWENNKWHPLSLINIHKEKKDYFTNYSVLKASIKSYIRVTYPYVTGDVS